MYVFKFYIVYILLDLNNWITNNYESSSNNINGMFIQRYLVFNNVLKTLAQ